MNKPITIFCCNPWESYMAELEARCDAAEVEYDHERDLDDVATLQSREPLFFEERAETDPHWPPPELDQFEECEPDAALEVA